jgi:hypothetical protein
MNRPHSCRRLRLSSLLLLPLCIPATAQPSPAADPSVGEGHRLDFTGPDQGEYTFDTGVLRGTLHRGGKSLGLLPVTDVASSKTLTKSYGWLSPYRILSARTQHGYAAWDWASQTERLPDGAVSVRWRANDSYPLDMTAVYRWKTPGAADLSLTVTARQELAQLEVFVASYFEGFTQAFVYGQTGAEPAAAFVPALRADGVWHVFPRDDAAAQRIADGRWRHPPAPVTWVVRNRLAAPVALRRNPELGLTALVMAPATDCFAAYTPFGEEGHGSLYLSLLGGDLRAGQSATGRARLVIGRGLTDEQAVQSYRDYLAELQRP